MRSSAVSGDPPSPSVSRHVSPPADTIHRSLMSTCVSRPTEAAPLPRLAFDQSRPVEVLLFNRTVVPDVKYFHYVVLAAPEDTSSVTSPVRSGLGAVAVPPRQ